jgi:hypothetical protein
MRQAEVLSALQSPQQESASTLASADSGGVLISPGSHASGLSADDTNVFYVGSDMTSNPA